MIVPVDAEQVLPLDRHRRTRSGGSDLVGVRDEQHGGTADRRMSTNAFNGRLWRCCRGRHPARRDHHRVRHVVGRSGAAPCARLHSHDHTLVAVALTPHARNADLLIVRPDASDTRVNIRLPSP
jgi:hypothetical protein